MGRAAAARGKATDGTTDGTTDGGTPAVAAAGTATLRELVLAGDVAAVIEACLAGIALAPAERAAAVKSCGEIVRKGWWSEPAFTHEQLDAATVALAAVASVPELRALARWHAPRDLDVAFRLLAARDRAWRDAWVELACESVSHVDVHVARRLVHDGLATRPDTDAYTIALVAHPAAFDVHHPPAWRGHGSVLDTLRANPDLLDHDVWRIFEVEGGGENSLAAHDKYCSADNSWQAALVALAADGTLDRARLLDASLEALQRGFAQFRVQWFSAFHEALAPTPAERAARASTYLALTTSSIGPTVAMALKALDVIQKAGELDPVEAVAHLGPAVLAPAKGSATRAITLVVRAATADPAVVPDAAAVLADGLAHPSADVQKAALAPLRRWFPDAAALPAERAAVLRRLSAGCHPSVRAELEGWLDGAPSTSPTKAKPGGRAARPAVAPVARPAVRATAPTAADWLAPDRAVGAITPEGDLDALVEHVAAMVEAPGTPDEIEAVLAAVATIAHARVTGDGRARTAATLARRAAAVLDRTDRPSQLLVALTVLAWLDPDRAVTATLQHGRQPAVGAHTPPARGATRATPKALVLDELLGLRVDALVRSLLAREPAPVLAVPTHHFGVLDPLVFAERVRRAADAAAPIELAELAAALLRLAPDPVRLAEARAALDGVPGVPRRVDAWLGGWAERCSSDAASPGRWHAKEDPYEGYTHYELHMEGPATISPAGAPVEVRVSTHRWGGPFEQDPAAVAWMGSLVPGLPAAWARVGAAAVGPTYGTPTVEYGDPAYLERFFDPAVALGDDALLLLAFALNDARPSVQSVAVDLAIGSIDEARLDPLALGRQVGALASTGLVTPKRWGRSLADVAAHGPTHSASIVAVLEAAVGAAVPRKPQDLLDLVELLETLLLDAGTGVSWPAARDALARITGSSKTAKAAARVLALEPP